MLKLAILGFGVVGSGVAKVLEENASILEQRLGEPLSVQYILDIRDFTGHALAPRIVRDFSVIEQDSEVRVVVEAMGGRHPAYEYSLAALRAGKSVVTSNKELVAYHGQELLQVAKENGVRYLFEASVGGGIPIIRPLCDCLAANRITSVTGIMNGTTNYILTQMEAQGATFEAVLADAQLRGYAERDPSADIDGKDTCRKLCILSDIAFSHNISPDEVYCEGIRSITKEDIEDARLYGAHIKLLGHVRRVKGGIVPLVAPFLVKDQSILASVRGVFNGIGVTGNMVGETLFYGHGAGSYPTASAMVADVLEALEIPSSPLSWSQETPKGFLQKADSIAFPRYLRLKNPTSEHKKLLAPITQQVLRDTDEVLCVILTEQDAPSFAKTLSMLAPQVPESVLRVYRPGEYTPEE